MKSHKKAFKHGGSFALVLPAEFMRRAKTEEFVVEMSTNADGNVILTVMAPQKKTVQTLEEDPAFDLFIQALGVHALKNPKKLKTGKEVWRKGVDTLLQGVLDDED